MATIPQPYVYPWSSIPGGVFTGQMSERLDGLIEVKLPDWGNPVIGSDEEAATVTITGDTDLTDADKAILDGLVARSADFFIITKDGGRTDMGEPALLALKANGIESQIITLQYKNGDNTDSNGYDDPVKATSVGLLPIDKLSGSFDSSGKSVMVIQPSDMRGDVTVVVTSDKLPPKTLRVTWS